MSMNLNVEGVRSSRPQMFFKIGALKNFATSTGKHGLKACNFIKKRLRHRCFPMNIAKFFRTAFLMEHFWLLLLECVEKYEGKAIETLTHF